jgi:hypothetical protein
MIWKVYELPLYRREITEEPLWYSLPMSVPPSVKLKFQKTVGDGGCFFYTLIDCIIDLNVHHDIQKLGDVSSRRGLSGNRRGMMIIRKMIRDFLDYNMPSLLSKETNYFLDENGKPFCFLGTTKEDKLYDFDGEETSQVLSVIDKCWRPELDKLPPGEHLSTYFWPDAEIMIPLCCLMFGISLYYYNEVNGQQQTRWYYYRGDRRVQRFNSQQGWHAPHHGATGLRYHGSYHFESLKLSEVDVPSESPVALYSQPEIVVMGGEVADLNTPSLKKEARNLVKIRKLLQLLVTESS